MPDQSEAWLICQSNHHTDPWALTAAMPYSQVPTGSPQSRPTVPAAPKPVPQSADSAADLQRRLDNANAYFRRKAAEVLTDDSAVRLMAVLYQDGLVELADFNSGELGIPLAKIAAAGFCEIGVTAIYVTQSGERFVGSLIPSSPVTDATSSRKSPPTQTADNTL